MASALRRDASRPAVTPVLETARQIVAAIVTRGHVAVIAGGAVRDRVLGRPVTDVDIATTMPLDELSALFTTHAVGRSRQFETVVVVREGHAFEITRLRGGPTDREHPTALGGADALRADTAHRDFTINALLLDTDGGVIDYQGGLEDVRRGVVRAVGAARERFAEDPARLLRAVRFAACLNFEIEPGTAAAIVAGAPLLSGVAGERIGGEILKMAAAPGKTLARAVTLLDQFGLLRTVLPEVADLHGLEQPAEWHPEGDAWEHTLAALRASASADPAVNLAVLLHDVGKRPAHFVENGRHRYHGHESAGLGLVEAIARRLTLPQRLRAAILYAVEHHGRGGRLVELRRSQRLALVASEHWPVLRALVLCDIGARGDATVVARAEEVFAEAERDAAAGGRRPADAPVIAGERIMALAGLAPGPRVGEIQRRITEWALDARIEQREAIEAEVLRLVAESRARPAGPTPEGGRREETR